MGKQHITPQFYVNNVPMKTPFMNNNFTITEEVGNNLDNNVDSLIKH